MAKSGANNGYKGGRGRSVKWLTWSVTQFHLLKPSGTSRYFQSLLTLHAAQEAITR